MAKRKDSSNSAFSNLLEYVAVTDRTKAYEIDEPNIRGDLPRQGTAWRTPKEDAQELARQFEIDLDARNEGQKARAVQPKDNSNGS